MWDGALWERGSKILEIMARFKSYVIMLDLGLNYMIPHMFQCFVFPTLRNIIQIVSRKTCKLLCLQLWMTVMPFIGSYNPSYWTFGGRKSVSPTTYELEERLVKQNMRLVKRKSTKDDLTKMKEQFFPSNHLSGVGEDKDAKVQTCKKNELRRENILFHCKGPWEPNHSFLSKIVEMVR